jgi:dihydroorotate dehydrogenase electron transfer subunit
LTKYSGNYPILNKEKTSPSVIKFTLETPEIAKSSQPGQFVQVRPSETYFPLWPRPFSIYDADSETGKIVIVFKIAGCGTSQMANKNSGQTMHILGPLGNGFPSLPLKRKVILASGGVGLPPLFFLAKKSIVGGYPVRNLTFIAGGKSADDILEKAGLLELGIEASICTDDGSLGFKGTVVDLLKKHLDENFDCIVYACGPTLMLKGIDDLLISRGIPGLLSLEALMPCGYGICSGCAVKVTLPVGRGPTDDNRDFHLKRICVDGPVFNTGEVIW